MHMYEGYKLLRKDIIIIVHVHVLLRNTTLELYSFRLFRNLTKEVSLYAQKFVDRGKVSAHSYLLIVTDVLSQPCTSGL